MRRVATMVIGAALVLLVAGACSGNGNSNKTPTTAPARTSTAGGTGSSTPAAGLPSPTVAGGAQSTPEPQETTTGLRACDAADVSTRASEQSAEGDIGGAVTVTNTSSSTCQISAPVVTLRDSAGTELANGSAGGGSVGLDAGRSASITFIWTNYCGNAPSGPLSVSVAAGADPIVTNIAGTSASTVPVPRCDAQADPSKVSVTDVRLLPAG